MIHVVRKLMRIPASMGGNRTVNNVMPSVRCATELTAAAG